ncbi:alpha/beta hydrolase [Burkholderia sp. MSMB1459WGS]|uniref:alpha/beta hydrolase n=1 Tax=Burkholderia sp. MSMB1459WGS TaxID=1637970 RepID=UPI00359C302D
MNDPRPPVPPRSRTVRGAAAGRCAPKAPTVADPGNRCRGWPRLRLYRPAARLPFPSIVVESRNDPLALRTHRDADGRVGSQLVHLGEVGHLNPASRYGEWRDAERLANETIALGEGRSGPRD